MNPLKETSEEKKGKQIKELKKENLTEKRESKKKQER
jgi:hypothetical protein